jgi:hypothetical protein
MKKFFASTVCMLLYNFMLFSQTSNKLSTLATELFKNIKSTSTVNEKNFIAQQTGFVLSGNKEQPFALDKDSKEYPFSAIVLPLDLNKDGKEEIFISFGNGYTSGNTGSSIVLFIKNATGVYEMSLGFPGMIPDILATTNKGYPDLVIGGPGLEYPILRWNGKMYDSYKTIKDSDYEKTKKINADIISKEYQKTLK